MTGHEDILTLQADFRAAVIQATTGSGDDPEHPQTAEQIRRLEQEYAMHLEYSRIYISGKNDIPGFRKVVFLGPDHDGNRITGHIHVIAVTSDCRLVTGTIRHARYMSIDDYKPITTAQAIETLVNPDGRDLKFVNGYVNFDLRDIDNPKYTSNSINQISAHVYCSDIYTEAKNEIVKFLCQQIQTRFTSARLAIVDALDENILCDMQENNFTKVSKGRWLTGGDGVAADVVTARQQAVRAYPLLSGMFYQDETWHDVIDTKASLSKAIANYFRVSETRVKRLSGLAWDQVGFMPLPLKETENMVSDFLHLPDNSFPRNARQFEDLEIIREFGNNLYNEKLLDITGRLSKNGNLWRFITRMKETSGNNVDDAVQFLARKLVAPAMIYKNEHKQDDRNKSGMSSYSEADYSYFNFNFTREAKIAIKDHFSFRELLDWSDRYHRNIARYEDRLEIISVDRDWQGMLGTIELDNGCIARELTSSVELKAQGRAEDHCVGGYVSRILDNRDHSEGRAMLIFSIEQNDRILSTVEITCYREHSPSDEFGQKEKYHLCAHVEQNLARNNKTPCHMVENLAEQIVARVQQAGMKAFLTYLDGLHAVCTEHDRISDFGSYIAECGLDPRDRTHLEIVWEELRSAMPRRYRNDDLEGLIQSGLYRKTCQTDSPKMQSSCQDRVIHAEGQRTIYAEGQHVIHVERQQDMQPERMPEYG